MGDVRKLACFLSSEAMPPDRVRNADLVLVIEHHDKKAGPVKFKVVKDSHGSARTVKGDVAQELLDSRS